MLGVPLIEGDCVPERVSFAVTAAEMELVIVCVDDCVEEPLPVPCGVLEKEEEPLAVPVGAGVARVLASAVTEAVPVAALVCVELRDSDDEAVAAADCKAVALGLVDALSVLESVAAAVATALVVADGDVDADAEFEAELVTFGVDRAVDVTLVVTVRDRVPETVSLAVPVREGEGLTLGESVFSGVGAPEGVPLVVALAELVPVIVALAVCDGVMVATAVGSAEGVRVPVPL